MAEIPKDWKVAAATEEEIDFILYDLVASGTTASAEKIFFNQNRSTSGLAVTNMEIAGQLPSTHRFLIKKLGLLIDVNAAAGDSADVLDSAITELYINNKLIFSAPSPIFALPIDISTTRTAEVGGAAGQVEFELDKYVTIQGGTPFKVSMTIGKTAASASTDLTYLLRGKLIRPSA